MTNQRPDEVWSFQTQRSQKWVAKFNSSNWLNLFVNKLTTCTSLLWFSCSFFCLFFVFWRGIYYMVSVCLFVCLTGRSVRRHTWVLMGSNSNKMLKPLKSLYKYAGQLVYGSELKRERNRFDRYEMKEKKTMDTPNKSSWTILISAFGTRERRFFIQSQMPLRFCIN